MPGTPYQLEILPTLPPRLARLEELAYDLWYSWDRPTRMLFSRLHPNLWAAVGHSPKAFLKRIDQKRLDAAAEDPAFLGGMNRVLSSFDTYHGEAERHDVPRLPKGERVAYFCAEFGFHESLPIYSGGLGILAGDHCKTASDMNLPFAGVGLLYRQGYFSQQIDNEGNQRAAYSDSDFDDMPIRPVNNADGSDLHIGVELPGRTVLVKVWLARIGRVTLYLLDTDLETNGPHDRGIAHRLYGGDRTTRIEQEIILGVGGVRALAAVGVAPTVWHINEGHAAFLVLERIRGLTRQGLEFAAALEAVAANTVFTTHTAVPAGHDHFAEDMVRRYFETYCRDLGIRHEDLMTLGRADGSPDFNMTALAIRGSRFHNGVSRIHGGVSARICSHLWPQVEPDENPVRYVTNGVHVPTFLVQDWHEMFDRYLGPGWLQQLTEVKSWEGVYHIPDQQFWSVRQSLKAQMLYLLRRRLAEQSTRNNGSEAHLDRILRLADPANPNVLTIGFARRFATYKRATLLFSNLDWLREIVSDPKRPVLFIFAGKAHPADQPGQELIRRISEISRMAEFEGRVLMVEGYELRLARRLVSGCDVWLNNPVYPLEASGTSGMKAALNGVLNLSVLDGWWDEGYDGTNGWAIKAASPNLDEYRRNQEEARTLYELLQDQVIPLYYEVGALGFSPRWVQMSKHAIASLLPRFSSERMVGEYIQNFYSPAARQWGRMSAESFAPARKLAQWKARVRAGWSGVTLRRLDAAPRRVRYGETMRLTIAANLNGLAPEDVTVELMFTRPTSEGERRHTRARPLPYSGRREGNEHVFELDITPETCGKIEYRFRIYPSHPLLTHPFEMGMMVWL